MRICGFFSLVRLLASLGAVYVQVCMETGCGPSSYSLCQVSYTIHWKLKQRNKTLKNTGPSQKEALDFSSLVFQTFLCCFLQVLPVQLIPDGICHLSSSCQLLSIGLLYFSLSVNGRKSPKSKTQLSPPTPRPASFSTSSPVICLLLSILLPHAPASLVAFTIPCTRAFAFPPVSLPSASSPSTLCSNLYQNAPSRMLP